MKHYLLAFGLLASLAATGCATSTGVDDDGGTSDQDAAVKADVVKPTTDSSTKPDTSTTQQCVPTCATDEDCESSCPQVPNGVNCCDTSTGICYPYSSSVCPEPIADAGFD